MFETHLQSLAHEVFNGVHAVDLNVVDGAFGTRRWRLGPYFSGARAQHAASLVDLYLRQAMRSGCVSRQDVEDAYERAELVPTYDFDAWGRPIRVY
ncbi:MAG TPA: hypothetical protein VFT22_11715 [Kofleriaceae bacterium]|nr:hypothetical protein [Kofleriaceae bacterium]